MPETPPRTVRFVSAKVDVTDKVSHARVELERVGKGKYVGTGESQGDGLDDYLSGAHAAARAVEQAADNKEARVDVIALDVVHVVRQTLVIVSVSASFKGVTRELYGVCLDREDRASAGALAVLNATNRAFDMAAR